MMYRIHSHHDQIGVVAKFCTRGIVKLRLRSFKGIYRIDVHRIWETRGLALHFVLVQDSCVIIHVNSGITPSTTTCADQQEEEHCNDSQKAFLKPPCSGLYIYAHLSNSSFSLCSN